VTSDAIGGHGEWMAARNSNTNPKFQIRVGVRHSRNRFKYLPVGVQIKYRALPKLTTGNCIHFNVRQATSTRAKIKPGQRNIALTAYPSPASEAVTSGCRPSAGMRSSRVGLCKPPLPGLNLTQRLEPNRLGTPRRGDVNPCKCFRKIWGNRESRQSPDSRDRGLFRGFFARLVGRFCIG